MLNGFQQRRIREAAVESQSLQFACGGADPLQHSERILVLVKVADPQDSGIAFNAGDAARFITITWRETSGRFWNFIHLCRHPN